MQLEHKPSLDILASSQRVRATAWRPRLTIVACAAFIIFSVASFAYNTLGRTTTNSADYYIFYSAGKLWNEGANPYDYTLFRSVFTDVAGTYAHVNPSGYYYPPQASVLFSLMAHFPVETAHTVYTVINLALLLIALVLFRKIVSRYTPVTIIESALIVGLINTGFGRGNIREGQSGLLVCVLLFAAFVCSERQREGLTGVALGAISYKPTFLPFYFAYFAFRRRYRVVLIGGALAVMLTILPLLVTHRPVLATLLAWVHTSALQNGPGTMSDPSPFVPGSALMIHVQPLIYRILNGQSTLGTAVAWALVGGACIVAARLSRSGRQTAETRLLDFAIVSAISLIAVYHRSYDIFLLFPGLLCIYLHTLHQQPAAARYWAVFLASVMVMFFLPGDLLLRFNRFSALEGLSYIWRVLTPFQTWACLATLGALFWLRAQPSDEAVAGGRLG